MLELVNMLDIATCNAGLEFEIPTPVFRLVAYVILIIQIIVPILLIIWGMLDFAKGLVKGKDEDIKAGQKTFVSRLIVAVIVFLIVTVTKLLVSLIGGLGADGATDSNKLTNCIEAFVEGK